MKIYLASSGRNATLFHKTRAALMRVGHSVHDWTTGPAAYAWPEVGVLDTDACSTQQMIASSGNDMLRAGMRADLDALAACDAFVLLLPAGADAHFEFGWAVARGKTVLVLAPTGFLRASQFYSIPGWTGSIYAGVDEVIKALEAL